MLQTFVDFRYLGCLFELFLLLLLPVFVEQSIVQPPQPKKPPMVVVVSIICCLALHKLVNIGKCTLTLQKFTMEQF